jgi:hypothetical protein
MKKSLILPFISLICAIFLFACSGHNGQNSLTRQKLKGDVKTMEIRSYYATEKYGEVQTGDLSHRMTFKYDQSGNQLEMNFYLSNDELVSKNIFTYDQNGNETEVTTFIHGKKTKAILKIDENGNPTETYSYDSTGALTQRTTSLYDDKGNLTEWDKYGPKGDLISKNTFKYDDLGNQIELNVYDSRGEFLEKQIDKYDKVDKKGNWIKQIIFRYDKPFMITERKIEYY